MTAIASAAQREQQLEAELAAMEAVWADMRISIVLSEAASAAAGSAHTLRLGSLDRIQASSSASNVRSFLGDDQSDTVQVPGPCGFRRCSNGPSCGWPVCCPWKQTQLAGQPAGACCLQKAHKHMLTASSSAGLIMLSSAGRCVLHAVHVAAPAGS